MKHDDTTPPFFFALIICNAGLTVFAVEASAPATMPSASPISTSIVEK